MEVQIEKEQKSPYQYELKVTVAAEIMAEKIKEATDDFAKNAAIRGFRPGHVPRKVIEQQFGPKLAAEVAQDVLQEAYRDALEQSKLEPLAPGEMSDVQFKRGDPLTFAVMVEVMPEFQLPVLSEVSVELPVPEVGEEDILAAVDGLRESHATLASTDEPADENCIITVDMQELDASGLPIVGRTQKDLEIDLSRAQLGEDFAAKVIGLSSGGTAIVELQVRSQEAEAKPSRFQVTVTAVKRKELPPLDEDFVKTINPRLESVDALKEDIRQYLDARAQHNAHEKMFHEVVDALLKLVDFPVPPKMLDAYLDRVAADALKNRKRKPEHADIEHFKEEYRASAIWNLRWYLMRKKIITERQLEVTDDEYKSEIERLAQIDGLHVSEFEKKLSEEQVDHVHEDLLERKVLALVESEIQAIPHKMSLAEFEGRTPGRIVTV